MRNEMEALAVSPRLYKEFKDLEYKIEEKDKQIQRLKHGRQQMAKDLHDRKQEIERLNNIINELENIIDIEMNKMGYAKYDSCLMLMKMKIKELKGEDRE